MMRPPVFFHVIARAVIFVDGLVLLAHAKGENHTFLPGGHVEPGEPVTRSLAPASREPHLEFVWSSPDELDGRNLLPRVLRHLLRRWASGDASTWWATDQE